MMPNGTTEKWARKRQKVSLVNEFSTVNHNSILPLLTNWEIIGCQVEHPE